LEEAETQLAEMLARVTRLRQQRRRLQDDGSLLLDRSLADLEENLEPDSPAPMPEEQSSGISC
jgi:hypothetical protein